VTDPDNVALVRLGFEYVRRGDVAGMLSLWDENLDYYGFDASGLPVEYHGRDEALEMVTTGEKLVGDHSYDIVDIRPAGAELVIVHARIQFASRSPEESRTTDYVAVYRVRDGRVVSCCDFIDSATQRMLDRAWS